MEPLNNNNENKLDLMQIAGVILANFWLIALVSIFGMLCGLLYTKKTTVASYTSSTKLYVLSKSSDGTDVTSSDLSLSSTLAGDYVALIKDRTVTESVISQLGLDISSGALASKITVGMPDSGRIITISVTDSDPYMASRLVTAVRDTAAQHIKDVMGVAAVNVVEEANIPQGQSMAGYQRNGLLGAVAGAGIVIAIILLQYMMNDTIKSEEDLKQYLDLSALGVIPFDEEEKKRKSKRKRKKKKNVAGEGGEVAYAEVNNTKGNQ